MVYAILEFRFLVIDLKMIYYLLFLRTLVAHNTNEMISPQDDCRFGGISAESSHQLPSEDASVRALVG